MLANLFAKCFSYLIRFILNHYGSRGKVFTRIIKSSVRLSSVSHNALVSNRAAFMACGLERWYFYGLGGGFTTK